jgi:hypothetical protein
MMPSSADAADKVVAYGPSRRQSPRNRRALTVDDLHTVTTDDLRLATGGCRAPAGGGPA